MSKIDNEIIHQQLNWRYACKKFDPTKKIREADWNILSESLRLSASSYGLQPWKFIVVQNTELRQKLFEASFKQSPVLDCSHFVVLCSLKELNESDIINHANDIATTRNLDPELLKGYIRVAVNDLIKGPRFKTIDHWAQRQVYIALGTILTTAAMMEIDALPMEGLVASEYDKILNLENTNYCSLVAVACGYRHPDDKYQYNKKVRKSISQAFDYRT